MKHRPTEKQIIAYLQNGDDSLKFSFKENQTFDQTQDCPGVISIQDGLSKSAQRLTQLLSLLSDGNFKATIGDSTMNEEYIDKQGVVTLEYKKVFLGDFWQAKGIKEFLVLCTDEVLEKLLDLVADSQKQKAAATPAVNELQ